MILVCVQTVEDERLRLQAEVDLAAARLNRAGKLTQALADEQTRWEESVKVRLTRWRCSSYAI